MRAPYTDRSRGLRSLLRTFAFLAVLQSWLCEVHTLGSNPWFRYGLGSLLTFALAIAAITLIRVRLGERREFREAH